MSGLPGLQPETVAQTIGRLLIEVGSACLQPEKLLQSPRNASTESDLSVSALNERQNDAISLTVFILVGSFTYTRTYFSDRLLALAFLAPILQQTGFQRTSQLRGILPGHLAGSHPSHLSRHRYGLLLCFHHSTWPLRGGGGPVTVPKQLVTGW